MRYGVATISRLLKIIDLRCRISSFLYRALLQKRPINSRSLVIEATLIYIIWVVLMHVDCILVLCVCVCGVSADVCILHICEQCVAVSCSVLQCVAVCCSVLQCHAAFTQMCVSSISRSFAACCELIQICVCIYISFWRSLHLYTRINKNREIHMYSLNIILVLPFFNPA